MTGLAPPQDRFPPSSTGGVLDRLWPWAVFVALALVTLLVWRQQVGHQRELVRHHSEAVGQQAARRFETFVQSQLTAASIFARRWASHEGGDLSRSRFQEFARILIQTAPGLQALRLVTPDGREEWVTPETARGPIPLSAEAARRLFAEARRTGEGVLSEPVLQGGAAQLLSVLPLSRGEAPLGFLVVELHIPTLMSDCFHHRLRAGFRFRLKIGSRELYRHPQGGVDPAHGIRTLHPVRLGAQRLTLEMVPRRVQDIAYDAPGNLLLLVLGLLLAAIVAILARQLSRRMRAYREARDRALAELQERRRTEEALQAVEAGYHSVFTAATDGILVLDDFGIVQEANPAAGDMLGFEASSLVGVDVRTLLPADQTQLFSAFQRQLRQRGRVRLDAVAVREDGTSFDVEIRGTTYRQGEARRILALLTDVADRKRAERKLAQLSRSVLMAQESERARVARDLHDELGQILTALRLELGLLQKRLARSPEQGDEAWRGVTELVTASAQELRRVCQGLRPPLLDDLGLGPAVEQMVERYEERTGIPVALELRLVDPDPPLRAEVALCAYRILQESLTNANRHAQATQVSVSLLRKEKGLHLSIYDNGRGFEEERLGHDGAGLTGMRERAHLVGGTLEIRSVPEEGTRITFHVPLAPPPLAVEGPGEPPEDSAATEGEEPAVPAEEGIP